MSAPEQQNNAPAAGEVATEEKSIEARYIELLERHVRLLEGKLKAGDGNVADPPKGKASHVRSDSTVAQAGADGKDGEEKNGTASSGEKRVQYRKKVINESGFLVEEPYEHEAKKPETPKEEQSRTAATVIKYFDSRQVNYDTEIKIESAAAREILQEKLRHYPDFHWDNPNLSILTPFTPLVHNWDILEEASKGDTNGARDLAAILDAVKDTGGVKDYLEKQESTNDLVSFGLLWTVFKPGELVLMPSSFMKRKQAFILRNTTVRQLHPGSRKTYMSASCWAYDWNGLERTFNRVGVELKIESYKGQKLVTSLPFYPLSFYKGDVEELRTELIDRGKRFREFCISPPGKQMFEYDGMAHYRGTGLRRLEGADKSGSLPDDSMSVTHNIPPPFNRSISSDPTGGSGRSLTMKGKVMVDFESYSRHGPNEPIPMGELTVSEDDKDEECRCLKCEHEDGPRGNQRYDWDEVQPSDTFSDDQYLICPPRVLGYHLMEKKWVELLVDKVQVIMNKQVKHAFDKLQLGAKQKELISQLVSGHANDKTSDGKSLRGRMNDLTKGKGEGLVILLHGPPGVGKTLTAESVAQLTGKPLFPMGVGDITTDPSLVEKRLEQLFELAAAWQAVMLFDEADVFLESRATTTDVTRVGLVSVLLRVLEYYQGILILTTNRIRSFDIAVQSRINLAVQFADLKEKQKINIFSNFIDQIPAAFVEEKRKILHFLTDDDEAANRLSELNGRQVRNIVFSAASLAGNRQDPDNVLRLEDVKRMLDETWNFQHHLRELTKAAREKNE
ncbi:hypothetical protein CkaCkLH20_11682 [Colletotrichum karsti]|uniref:AAA+ ATPase domain-containing protein n=1 Tax=Colletotrichum karsti TaxID=1095194 RepID=A0A9P6HU73_9PEZI|nr:uncharacterized protein CkaCkLH20_11682 [Colletotrichum karsti]KAF9870783.1 hypothetical protein CkaCkLH20_11682 [Colletotrichum karsti]